MIRVNDLFDLIVKIGGCGFATSLQSCVYINIL